MIICLCLSYIGYFILILLFSGAWFGIASYLEATKITIKSDLKKWLFPVSIVGGSLYVLSFLVAAFCLIYTLRKMINRCLTGNEGINYDVKKIENNLLIRLNIILIIFLPLSGCHFIGTSVAVLATENELKDNFYGAIIAFLVIGVLCIGIFFTALIIYLRKGKKLRRIQNTYKLQHNNMQSQEISDNKTSNQAYY